MKRAIVIWLSVLLLSSCASLSRYPGVGRTRRYTFEHPQVPAAFDGFRIAFVSDTHYPSKFRRRHLRNAVRALRDLGPDLLLLGGDYQEGCEHVEELFAELARATPPCGTAAVLGNNDYERCTDDIRAAMPTAALCDADFVILLTHTPDYVEDVPVAHADLALAGHTHGGQISLLRLWTPRTGSKYGTRLLSGLCTSSRGLPVVVTNGLGTSRLPVRLCAPSEIVLITLKRAR